VIELIGLLDEVFCVSDEDGPRLVLVCGSRKWTDRWEVFRAISDVSDWRRRNGWFDLCVLEGGQRGADLLSRQCAEQLGIDTREEPADWVGLGSAAGPYGELGWIGTACTRRDGTHVQDRPGGRGAHAAVFARERVGATGRDSQSRTGGARVRIFGESSFWNPEGRSAAPSYARHAHPGTESCWGGFAELCGLWSWGCIKARMRRGNKGFTTGTLIPL
jgi:hypothetical protein